MGYRDPGTCFDLLGPLRIRVGQRVAVPRGTVPRALLGALLLEPGEQVAADRLVELVWGPDRGSVANLHTSVFRLRSWLREHVPGGATVERVGDGYRLLIAGHAVDAVRFRELTAAAASGPNGQRIERLDEALGLWRGPVLGASLEWLVTAPAVVALNQARIAAARDLTDLCLGAGRLDPAVRHLRRVTEEHPFDEPLHALLIDALAAAGQRAEAAAVYHGLTQRLNEELGVSPSPQVRHRHLAATAEPVTGSAADGAPVEKMPAWPSPALLPPDVPDFAGRGEKVEALERLLAPGDGRRRTALAVAGIAGMGGIGKSTLAVHVAHRLADRYADGQLHINLRGVEQSPLDPADVLTLFLRALGVDWRAMPTDTAERMSLYRSLMAGRRILVVLDNAGSAQQVRPLMPGTASCAVLITSRPRLTGVEGARWIDLGVLGHDEATQLLHQSVGDDRVVEQPAEAAEVVRLCGGLPLAVRIAGARLAARPAWPLAHLAALLGDQRHRLDRLTTGDLEVRASLALSYDGLDQPTRQLFRLLGLFDVPDFTVWLAAAILETSVAEASKHIESLVDAQLLMATGADGAGQLRYRFHDLARLYARERADAEYGPQRRTRALELGFGHWLALAERMAPWVPGPCYAPVSGTALRPVSGFDAQNLPRLDPLRWFDAERATLLAAVRQACELGFDEVAFDLAGCLEKYFDIRGMYSDWVATNERVLAACRRAGNIRGEAVMLRGLIDVRTWCTDSPSSATMAELYAGAEQLLALFTQLNDLRGVSDAEVSRSWALASQGRQDMAIESATRALRLAEQTGHLGGQARAHVALAVAQRERARVDVGVAHLTEALAAARALGNPRYEATVLQFLGIGHLELGDLDVSERRLNESLAISHRYRDNYTDALTRLSLARLRALRGDPRARGEAEVALAIAREYHMRHHIADTLAVLGEIELAEGRPADAVRHLTESVEIWRSRGWFSYQANSLAMLGRAYASLGDIQAARRAVAEARDIYTDLDQTDKASEMADLLHSWPCCR